MRTLSALACAIIFLCCLSACDQQGINTPEASSPQEHIKGVPVNSTQRNQDVTLVALAIIPPQGLNIQATGVLTQAELGRATAQNATGAVNIFNNAPVDGFPVGKNQVKWTAIDEAGNTATAFQEINVDASLACDTKELFFNQRIWPVLDTYCMECHTENIVESPLNFVDAQQLNYLITNYKITEQSAFLQDASGLSLLLSKTQNVDDSHVGGLILASSSAEYVLLDNMVERFNLCNQISVVPIDIVKLSPWEQLRKTTLVLSSRLPSQSEINRVNAAQSALQLEQRMGSIIEGLLNETGFYFRLKEIYNDLLLTNAFANNAKALGLSFSTFGTSSYFSNSRLMQQGYNGTDSNAIRKAANFGVSQAPLELITYVVKNNLPFTDILTADYVMVNPYSATLFNVSIPGNPTFNFVYGNSVLQHNAEQFLPVKLTDINARQIPHAGILTTLPFLNRYPSTRTNANRKRARYVFEHFLGLDVEGISDRAGLNLDAIIGQVPVIDDPQCNVCHNVLDPVAGLFKNWNNKGAYQGDNQNWFDQRSPPQMLSPGMGSAPLTAPSSATALPWLASVIVADDRFVTQTVRTIFKGVTGIDSAIDTLFLQNLKNNFINSGFNLKALIKKIVLDDRFLAKNANQLTVVGEHDDYGTAHLLTPEQLHRKIETLFNGVQWQSPSKRNLLSIDTYGLLYGGIDSIEITRRTTQATSLIAGVQMRIANQLSCELVPQDFNLLGPQRNLFPFVEISMLPEVATNVGSIKQNIQFLFEKILGAQYDINHPEIIRAFDLFVNARLSSGVEPVVRECIGAMSEQNPIVVDANRTVHAWIAIINFMLRDYRFLYD